MNHDDIDAILSDIGSGETPPAGVQGAEPVGRFAHQVFGDTSQQGKTLRRVREKALGDPFHKMASGRTYAEALDQIAQNTNADLSPVANQATAGQSAHAGAGRVMLNMGGNLARVAQMFPQAGGMPGVSNPNMDAFDRMVNENDEMYRQAHPWAHMGGEAAAYMGAGAALGPVGEAAGAPALGMDAALGALGSSGDARQRGMDVGTAVGAGLVGRAAGRAGGALWQRARGKPFSEEVGALGRWVRDQFHPTMPKPDRLALPPAPIPVGPASGAPMGAGPQFDPNGQGWLPGMQPGVPPEMQVTGGQPPGWPSAQPAQAQRMLPQGQPNVPRTDTGAIPVGAAPPPTPSWEMQVQSGGVPQGWPTENPASRIPIPQDMEVPGLLDRGAQNWPEAEPFAPGGAQSGPQTPTGQSLAGALQIGQERVAQQEAEIAQQLEPLLADVPEELRAAVSAKVRPSVDRVLRANSPEAHTQAAETLVRNIEKVKAAEMARAAKAGAPNAPYVPPTPAPSEPIPIEGLSGGEAQQIPIGGGEAPPPTQTDLSSMSHEQLGQAYQDALARDHPGDIAALEAEQTARLREMGVPDEEIIQARARARGELPAPNEAPAAAPTDPAALGQEGLTLRDPGLTGPKRVRSFSALNERLGLGGGKRDVALGAVEALKRHQILPQVSKDLEEVFNAVEQGGELSNQKLDGIVTRLQKAFKSPTAKMKEIARNDPAGWKALKEFADQVGGGPSKLHEIGAGRRGPVRPEPPDLPRIRAGSIPLSADPNPELTRLSAPRPSEADWVEAHRMGVATAREGYKDFDGWAREMRSRSDLTPEQLDQLWSEMTGKAAPQARKGFHPGTAQGRATQLEQQLRKGQPGYGDMKARELTEMMHEQRLRGGERAPTPSDVAPEAAAPDNVAQFPGGGPPTEPHVTYRQTPGSDFVRLKSGHWGYIDILHDDGSIYRKGVMVPWADVPEGAVITLPMERAPGVIADQIVNRTHGEPYRHPMLPPLD